jgi:hypothetical protein
MVVTFLPLTESVQTKLVPFTAPVVGAVGPLGLGEPGATVAVAVTVGAGLAVVAVGELVAFDALFWFVVVHAETPSSNAVITTNPKTLNIVIPPLESRSILI